MIVSSSAQPRIVKVSRPAPRPRPMGPRRPRVPPRKRSSGKGFLVFKVIVISFLLLILALMLVPQLRDSPLQWLNPLSYRSFPQMAEFTVDRRMSISGVQSFGFDIPEPKNIPGTQRVVSITTNPQPTTVEDRYGYDWMDWDATSGQVITVTTTFRTWTVWWEIDSDSSLTLNEARTWDPVFNSLSNQYNHDEWRIEVTHPDIVSKARQLEDSGGTVYDNVKSIFRYLDVNFEYSTREGGAVKTSSTTLADKKGDCDDMSFLFSALARAMGIPAWPVLGAMYTPLSGEWVGHGWMEVYIPTTNGGVNATIDMVNDEFLVRGANRFSDFRSDGDGDHLNDYYYSYSYVPNKFQTPEINDYFVDRGYDTEGTVTVKLGHDGRPVPLFEFLILFIVAIIAIIIILKLAKRRRRRRARARR
jgi:transglutaminase-like putative cysteine protease